MTLRNLTHPVSQTSDSNNPLIPLYTSQAR